MALLWIEGFEGFGTTTAGDPLPFGALARKYLAVANETNMRIEDGRLGGYCLRMPSSATFSLPALTTDDTLIAGCAFRTLGGSDFTILAFFDGTSKNINVRWADGTGEISIWLDNTLIDTSVGLGLLNDTWYYVEMKVKTNGATGTYDVEVAEVSIFSDTGIDTQSGANAYSDRVKFFGDNSAMPRWDDIYVCDSTGAVNNDMLGSPKVVSINPNGDDTANWGTSTPSGTHFENVDENPSDDDTSYVEESTANLTDLYDYESVSGSGDIYGIQINTMCRETDGTPFSLKTPIESNGSQYDDAGQAIGTTSYLTLVRVAETDPDTSNLWTDSGINAAKIGVKVG